MTRKSREIKTLLISLPWADFKYPSLQIATLSAFAQKDGWKVDSRHLHLEIAGLMGLKKYEDVKCKYLPYCGLIPAISLFPDKKKKISEYLKEQIKDERNLQNSFLKILKTTFKKVHWGFYDLIGFTATFNQLFPSLLYSKWIKNRYPEKKIVLGGVEVAGEIGKSILKSFSFIDWCVDGEGETAFVTLLEAMEINVKKPKIKSVPGLTFRDEGHISKNIRKEICDLNNLPAPNYDSYFETLNNHPSLINKAVKPHIVVAGSRACPYSCAYCNRNAHWDKFRFKSPENIADELEYLTNKYRVPRVLFSDDIILPDFLEKLCDKLILNNKDYGIFCEVRAGISKKKLIKMKIAGVETVQLGIESLSSSILRKMNKKTRTIENLQIMKQCKEIGIEVWSNLIIGFPTECQGEIDEVVKNIDYACAYNPPIRLIKFILMYGSPVFNNPQKYLVHSITNASYIRSILPNAISDLFISIERDYKSHNHRCDYRKLKNRWLLWREKYEDFNVDDQLLLKYYDVTSYITIEDYRFVDVALSRHAGNEIVLENEARELYIFCDSTKSFNEIKKRFPKWSSKNLRKTLKQLVQCKVMFCEDDDYLSLAIRANGPR